MNTTPLIVQGVPRRVSVNGTYSATVRFSINFGSLNVSHTYRDQRSIKKWTYPLPSLS
jgi:hypothetical protein